MCVRGRQCLKSESPQQIIYMPVNTSTCCTVVGPGSYPAWSLQCQKHRINTKQGQGQFSSIRGAASHNMLLSTPASSTSRRCSAKLRVNSGLKKKRENKIQQQQKQNKTESKNAWENQLRTYHYTTLAANELLPKHYQAELTLKNSQT